MFYIWNDRETTSTFVQPTLKRKTRSSKTDIESTIIGSQESSTKGFQQNM